MGDLFMLGKPLLGKFTAFKSGHDLNNKLIRKLAENPDTWEVATLDLESDETANLAQQYLDSKSEYESRTILLNHDFFKISRDSYINWNYCFGNFLYCYKK